ncbi:MAG: cupin domain-containing protein, partial [Ferrovibrio sp.]
MAGSPEDLIKMPDRQAGGSVAASDALSDMLRAVRLSGSMQFCLMPTGDWETDSKPRMAAKGGQNSIPFHILVEGTCWIKIDGQHVDLLPGDVMAFPFGTGHQLGAGRGGPPITPTADLPPKPWRELPVLRYGEGAQGVRLLCGYLQCDAMGFPPLRQALPKLIHVRTRGNADTGWLRATIEQIVSEVDRPRAGGISALERLTEMMFIELLRQQIIAARPDSIGWLVALGDAALGRCLALIHQEPQREWTVQSLAKAAGVSRSILAERFEAVLETSPMRYLRDWRLCLASVALTTTSRT